MSCSLKNRIRSAGNGRWRSSKTQSAAPIRSHSPGKTAIKKRQAPKLCCTKNLSPGAVRNAICRLRFRDRDNDNQFIVHLLSVAGKEQRIERKAVGSDTDTVSEDEENIETNQSANAACRGEDVEVLLMGSGRAVRKPARFLDGECTMCPPPLAGSEQLM